MGDCQSVTPTDCRSVVSIEKIAQKVKPNRQLILENTASRLYAFDRDVSKNNTLCVAGIDEAGRGPLAGPVVAAAVVLDPDKKISGLNDSKKLSAPVREILFHRIVQEAQCFAVGEASVEEIDRLNILQATLLAMRRALEPISVPWTLVLVDGNQPLGIVPASRQKTVVHGDRLSASIAAASIIAKVTRDAIMKDYHTRFPMYDFLTNKGYGTAAHRQRIRNVGLCELHRRTFCKKFMA